MKTDLTEKELEQLLYSCSFENKEHKEKLRKCLFDKKAAFADRYITPLSDEELELAAGGKAESREIPLHLDTDLSEEEWKKRMGLYW